MKTTLLFLAISLMIFYVRCQSCPSNLNCNRCDQPNQCSTCLANYFKTEATKGCCLNGLTFSDTSNRCVICPSFLNCLRCDQGNQCSVCMNNHTKS